MATPTVTSARAHAAGRARSEARHGAALAWPALVLMLAVTGYPIAHSVWLSFQRYALGEPDVRGFAGLENYLVVLSAPRWWVAMGTTLLIAVVSVAIQLVLGFAFAFVMHRAVFGRRTIRVALLVPYAIISVVSAFAWKFAFDPTVGFVNRWFDLSLNFFGQTWSSYLVIIAAEVWKTTPFLSLLLLAGLTGVPGELLESARVDGASAWQRFWHVIVPAMRGAIGVALLFRLLDAVRLFETVFVMTRGTNNTETLSMLGYDVLVSRLDLGLGSAISVLLFCTVALIAVLFLKGFRTDLTTVRGE